MKVTPELQRAVARAIANLRVVLIGMHDEDRVELFEQVIAGYCVHCGASVGDRYCHCRNDD